jgi:cellulose synthase/poly-beta-1,6-N-acetylglucosamine synthase-like glycosyltransferase
MPEHLPKIILIHCVCNDFSPEQLEQIIQQDYPNFQTVICDDSNDEKQVAQIDEFAKKHNLQICRRPLEHKMR